jgi:hypothetical protein
MVQIVLTRKTNVGYPSVVFMQSLQEVRQMIRHNYNIPYKLFDCLFPPQYLLESMISA